MRDHVEGRCRHVFVDEFQDVNPVQERIVRAMVNLGAKLTVVGDDDQAIYGWRGSDNRFITGFGKRYGQITPVDVVRLEESFRSSPGIVSLAQSVIRVNGNRLGKRTVCASHQTYQHGDVLAMAFDSPEDEALWIAQKIKSLVGTPFRDKCDGSERGISYSDIAILLRSAKASAGEIASALRMAHIPFVVSGMTGLFDRPEVVAAAASMRYLADLVSAEDVRASWMRADLGLSGSDLDAGIEVLDLAKEFDRYDRAKRANCELLSLQRVFLDLLEAFGLREERIPNADLGPVRGEIVYASLGKFSQVILDFERVCYLHEAARKCVSFGRWLEYEAPRLYEEVSESRGHATPDAVIVSTVHAAKGKEWPAVFIPQMTKNRFPLSSGQRGRSKWHVLPRAAVRDSGRYDINIAEERRLLYVAITRAKKWLFASFAPSPEGSFHNGPSPLFAQVRASDWALTAEPTVRGDCVKLTPTSLHQSPNVMLSFSQLKYLLECPYSFKLRFLYGFESPPNEGLGYGRGLHDAVKEIHRRALEGEIVGQDEAAEIVERNTYLPFASSVTKARLMRAAEEALTSYIGQEARSFKNVTHVELPLTITVAGGVTVTGRIDLVKRLDAGEEAIVDFKSKKRAQAESVSRQQLHAYVIGHEQLTGRRVDVVEVHNLDKDDTGVVLREKVDEALIEATRISLRKAGDAIRSRKLPRLAVEGDACKTCDFRGICRDDHAK